VEASPDLLSFALNFPAPPSGSLPASSSQLQPASTQAVVIVEEPPPELLKTLAPLDDLAATRTQPARIAPHTPVPVPVPFEFPAVLPYTAPTRLEAGFTPAGALLLGEIGLKPARDGKAAIIEQAEPLPSVRRSVAFVRADLRGADRAGMGLAPLGQLILQPDAVPLKPVVPYRNGQPDSALSSHLHLEPHQFEPSRPSVVSSRPELTGDSLGELLNALNRSEEEQDQAAIEAIQRSFAERPAWCLLSPPAEIVAPPAPPAAQWMRLGEPRFTPVAPPAAGYALSVAPQAPPLPGPSLPPQLLNLQQGTGGVQSNRRTWSSWMVTVLLAAIVTLVVAGLFQYVTQNRESRPASVAAPVQITRAAPAPLHVVQEHPAARSVEVAGVRVVTGPNKKPQLEYVVINHSSSEVTGLNIRIAVRSVESMGEAPLFSVSSVVAALGPNQSREIRTDLNSSIQPSAIPDWQSLRTAVLIARQ